MCLHFPLALHVCVWECLCECVYTLQPALRGWVLCSVLQGAGVRGPRSWRTLWGVWRCGPGARQALTAAVRPWPWSVTMNTTTSRPHHTRNYFLCPMLMCFGCCPVVLNKVLCLPVFQSRTSKRFSSRILQAVMSVDDSFIMTVNGRTYRAHGSIVQKDLRDY